MGVPSWDLGEGTLRVPTCHDKIKNAFDKIKNIFDSEKFFDPPINEERYTVVFFTLALCGRAGYYPPMPSTLGKKGAKRLNKQVARAELRRRMSTLKAAAEGESMDPAERKAMRKLRRRMKSLKAAVNSAADSVL